MRSVLCQTDVQQCCGNKGESRCTNTDLRSQGSQPDLLAPFHFQRPISSEQYYICQQFFSSLLVPGNFLGYNLHTTETLVQVYYLDGLGQTCIAVLTPQPKHFQHISQVTSSSYMHSQFPPIHLPPQPLICFVLLYIR